MLAKLCPRCISCGHVKCGDCPLELVKNKGTKNQNIEALQIGRAASLSAGDQSLHPTKTIQTSLTHSSQDETETRLLGVSEPESSRFSEDCECSPRSCQWDDYLDPSFDLVSTVDKDTFPAGLFGTESSFDFEGTLTSQFDTSSGSQPLHHNEWNAAIIPNDDMLATHHLLPQSLLNATCSTEACTQYADGYDPPQNQELGIAGHPTYTFEPQGPAQSFFEVDSVDGPQVPGNSQHSTSWINDASGLASESLGPQDTSIYAPTAQAVNPSYLLSIIEPLQHQSKASPSPESPLSYSPWNKTMGGENIDNKRLTSQVDRKDRHTNGSTEACESCSSATESDRAKPLACLFYKRNPDLYSACIFKDFKTISALRQHLNKDHKLRPYHCTSCWDSFHDNMSLKRHTNCQPTSGIPVDQLPMIYKGRDNSIMKWNWIWKRLFGKETPLPKCPYAHPMQDMKYHNLRQFSQYLATRGTSFTIDEVRDAMSTWVVSNT
ncbi:hypothetical protein F5Y13DRAFT_196290 [Hypoxylon sp. FL1857]|nr:hypothetical protein F5Y13DRAFT_196290 [Hypoxylon sp. FL1857]